MTELALQHGLCFPDLYDRDALVRLDRAFVAHLATTDVGLHDRLMTARAEPDGVDRKGESDLLVDLAPYLEDYIGELFGISGQVRELQARHDKLAPLFSVKRLFVQRRAVKEIKEADAALLNGHKLAQELETLIGGPPASFDSREGTLAWELRYAEAVGRWLDDEAAHPLPLKAALEYAAWATLTADGRHKHRRGLLFRVPHRLDMHHLVPVDTVERDGVTMLRLPEHDWRPRDGFALTDPGTDLAGALDQANYCIWCHNQQKDSCRSGLHEKDGGFKKSIFGVTLAGCPLDEKISEMNIVKARGNSIGALAIVAVDNPLCAATGHRICNDCMKACIYQRQEPVDIPQIETRTLKDVLALPWGFEIYGLLTRWNPLDLRRPLPKPQSGYKVLVVGLGPAGFNLAHHLINDGHFVAAIDGLKIEPLPPEISGVAATGERVTFEPIRDVAALHDRLDERTMAGFGGVAEYGITVRWDNNFLKIIRLLLERRSQFAMYGGVRFGGTLTIDSAFALGFDHIALCAGAGRPTVIPMQNGLVPGVRQASDFLMALQLTGAAKPDSIANLTVRLPVVVIGGGLTAIDTATEALAYYPVQVEKFLHRYETLVAERRAEPGQQAGEEVVLPARTILVAAGTQPNTVLAREDPDHVALDGRYFRALDEDGNPTTPERVAKPEAVRVLMSLLPDGRAVSFFGDLHPSFAGNVVKAMGGAKLGYPVVSRMLARRKPGVPEPTALRARLDDQLRPRVDRVERLTPKIVEVVVRAPMAARAFQPGQFYRLQNYATHAPHVDGTTLAMEGLALTGAWIDRDQGLLSTIVLEMGGSSDLCALLKPGEPVILMGPTGTATETPAGETVLLVGGGRGHAVPFQIGAALRARDSRVLYFAGYKEIEDRYRIADIERAADSVVWCCDEAPGCEPDRPQDLSFVGNIVAAIEAYGEGSLGQIEI